MRLTTRRRPPAALTVAAFLVVAGAWQAPAAPVAGPTLPQLTPASIRLALTPTTRAGTIRAINASPQLREAVIAAAGAMGLDTTKVLQTSTPPAAAATSQQPGTYTPQPCDWTAGVLLTFGQPLAATGWPPSEWAGMDMAGVDTSRAASGYGALLYAKDLQALSQKMSPWNGVVTLHPMPDRGWMHVELHPGQMALYVVDINLIGARLSDDFLVEAYRQPGGQNSVLVGSTVMANVLEIIVKVDKLFASVRDCVFVRVGGPAGPPWSFGAVTVRRL